MTVGPRLRILVVDDDPAIREIAKLSLNAFGNFDVHVAAGGQACLQAVREAPEPFDVMLLDLMMPGLDGSATLRHLRSLSGGAELPVILFSAALEHQRRVVDPHVIGTVSKPFRPAALVEQIESLLAGWDR